MEKGRVEGGLPTHGAAVLPSVTVDSYNVEARDEDGFIGDHLRFHAERLATS